MWEDWCQVPVDLSDTAHEVTSYVALLFKEEVYGLLQPKTSLPDTGQTLIKYLR